MMNFTGDTTASDETARQPKGEAKLDNGGESQRAPKRRKAGNLIVVTGPSGVGKGTVVSRLLGLVPDLTRSVSVTTREQRVGEVEGVDYFFRTAEQFFDMIEQSHFLESAEFAGHLYGTPSQWVFQQLGVGKDVILEIEVNGAKQIMQRFPEAVLIFLSPPSFEELRNRLRNRATETPDRVHLRLFKARQEMRQKHLFHYEVVNDNVDEAVTNLLHIVYAERCRIREHFEATGPSHEHD